MKNKICWEQTIFIIAVHLVALLGFFCFSWKALFVCLFLYWLTGCLGITLGFHRLLTHRSFKVPRWLEYFLTLCGTLAMQGGAISWVSAHRLHHKYSDLELDPHSPKKGFIWSHIEWTFRKADGLETFEDQVKLVPDLVNNEDFHSVFNIIVNNTGLLLNYLLGWALLLLGGWPLVIWGIFVRLVLVYHTTWLVNSVCHLWGYRSHETKDNSRNNWFVGLLSFGEGFHNNHHAFQYSARHGLKWWEFDSTYAIIKCLKFLGLASNIKE